MDVPEKLVPLYIRATGRNLPYVSEEGARRRIEEQALRPEPFGPPRRLDRQVEIVASRRDGWPVYTATPTSAAPSGCVVYAHGGGWVNEIVSQHWQLVAEIAERARTTVVVPIYPLVPFGTAEEVVGGFVDIVRESLDTYGDTRLAGDSAGGQIALSAALDLHHRHGITLSDTVLISPALDLTWSNPRIPDVQPDDPWLAVPGARYLSETWRGELAATDPRVSPLFGELAGQGRITLFSGTHDILNPDARLLASSLREAGVGMDFHEEEAVLHVYPLLPTASGRLAREIIIDRLAGGTD